MVEYDKRNNYFNAFLKTATKYLKSGIGLVMSFYGYQTGCVIKIELKTSSAHHAEEKQESDDISDALFKTHLLPKETCDAVRGKTVHGTMVAISSINCYVLMKSDGETEWTDEAAEKDFIRVIKKVVEKYGRK